MLWDALGLPLVIPWGLFGSLGPPFRSLWVSLDALWLPFGRLWGARGIPWGALGRPWDPLGDLGVFGSLWEPPPQADGSQVPRLRTKTSLLEFARRSRRFRRNGPRTTVQAPRSTRAGDQDDVSFTNSLKIIYPYSHIHIATTSFRHCLACLSRAGSCHPVM